MTRKQKLQLLIELKGNCVGVNTLHCLSCPLVIGKSCVCLNGKARLDKAISIYSRDYNLSELMEILL